MGMKERIFQGRGALTSTPYKAYSVVAVIVFEVRIKSNTARRVSGFDI